MNTLFVFLALIACFLFYGVFLYEGQFYIRYVWNLVVCFCSVCPRLMCGPNMMWNLSFFMAVETDMIISESY